MNKKDIYKKLIIPTTFFGSRLDHVLTELLPELSRSKIQNMIKQNLVMINSKTAVQKYKVLGDEEIIIKDIICDEITVRPENMPLDIIYEDDEIQPAPGQKELGHFHLWKSTPHIRHLQYPFEVLEID